MKIVKKDSALGIKDVILEENGKSLSFRFMGNLDLYWTIDNSNRTKDDNIGYEDFTITKENYEIYSLFEKLFCDIKNINISGYNGTSEYYREYHISNYDELIDSSEQIITWYSDETVHKIANILRIRKMDDMFKIEFYTQPYVKGYNREINFPGHISVRISNFGSRYEPFNTIFMRMFSLMQKVDDISTSYHQYHLEEYMFDLSKKESLKQGPTLIKKLK